MEDYFSGMEDYSGEMKDRLDFLKSKHIAGVIIWPGDEISDDSLAALRKELESVYDYIDCKGNGEKNAGVFVLRNPEKN